MHRFARIFRTEESQVLLFTATDTEKDRVEVVVMARVGEEGTEMKLTLGFNGNIEESEKLADQALRECTQEKAERLFGAMKAEYTNLLGE
jgi:hypothetical protein